MGQEATRGLDASVIDYGGARLTGVAEAKLSADSSDVVRGSQLYATNEELQSYLPRRDLLLSVIKGLGRQRRQGQSGLRLVTPLRLLCKVKGPLPLEASRGPTERTQWRSVEQLTSMLRLSMALLSASIPLSMKQTVLQSVLAVRSSRGKL